jgi:hypothetical protein
VTQREVERRLRFSESESPLQARFSAIPKRKKLTAEQFVRSAHQILVGHPEARPSRYAAQ